MATWNAIAATSRAILGLLEDNYPRARFGKLAFTPIHASDFAGEKPIPEGYLLLLYQTGYNGTLRNLPPRVDPSGTTYRPSLPLDLYYLLTAWAGNVEMQQRMLGWAVRHLEDTPILPAGVLNKYLQEPDVFRPEETVELVSNPLAFSDYANLWDKLKPRLPTAVTYVARMVLIDSEVEIRQGRPVQTRVLEMAKPIR